MKDVRTAIQERRSYYDIRKESPVSDDRIQQLVREAVQHCPTPFNVQSGRAVLLLNAHHDRLWEIVLDTLRSRVDPAKFESTEQKIRGFAAGYGSVLFFNDDARTEAAAEENPRYREYFTLWSQQAAGMLQYAVWILLEAEGFGASLQHYNPIIDEAAGREWSIPDAWTLLAQMPFGSPGSEPAPKSFEPIKERFRYFQ